MAPTVNPYQITKRNASNVSYLTESGLTRDLNCFVKYQQIEKPIFVTGKLLCKNNSFRKVELLA